MVEATELVVSNNTIAKGLWMAVQPSALDVPSRQRIGLAPACRRASTRSGTDARTEGDQSLPEGVGFRRRQAGVAVAQTAGTEGDTEVAQSLSEQAGLRNRQAGMVVATGMADNKEQTALLHQDDRTRSRVVLVGTAYCVAGAGMRTWLEPVRALGLPTCPALHLSLLVGELPYPHT